MITVDLLLRRSPSFGAVSDEDLASVSGAFHVDDYPAGHVFAREGDTSEDVFLVCAGEVVARRGGTEIYRMRPGALFGLMSLVDAGPRMATYRADEDCAVATLKRAEAEDLFHRHAPIALAFQRAVAKQLASDFRRLNAFLRECVGDTGAALLAKR